MIPLLAVAVGCQRDPAAEISLRQRSAEAASVGMASKDAYYEILDVKDRVKPSGTISDPDLAKLCGYIASNDPVNPGYVHLRAVAILTLVKKFSPGQKAKIWSAGLHLFKRSEWNDDNAAIHIAMIVDHPDAPKLVVPLLKSKNPMVVKRAKAYLSAKSKP